MCVDTGAGTKTAHGAPGADCKHCTFGCGLCCCGGHGEALSWTNGVDRNSDPAAIKKLGTAGAGAGAGAQGALPQATRSGLVKADPKLLEKAKRRR